MRGLLSLAARAAGRLSPLRGGGAGLSGLCRGGLGRLGAGRWIGAVRSALGDLLGGLTELPCGLEKLIVAGEFAATLEVVDTR